MMSSLIMVVMGNISNKRGFTLVELVIVMTIIAVLAVLVVGAISVARNLSGNTGLESDAKNIRDLLEVYYAEHKEYPKNGSIPYSRVDGYSFYASTTTTGAGQANSELASYVSPPYPIPPENGHGGIICYSGGGADYWLWMLTKEERKTKTCKADGFAGASAGSKIHCPNGQSSFGCSSQYWY